VVNHTGHKLPTGYGEGRRVWIDVRFYDVGNNLLAERGAYDLATAQLDAASTKVYEIEHGIDANMAAATGLASGPSFHFVLNNKIWKDNRIPPRGFKLQDFTASQALPVNAFFQEEQYWDDTAYAIPAGAHHAQVALFHQTTSKEYIEFLRDANTTNAAGQTAYDQWVLQGKSAPVLMQVTNLQVIVPSCLPPIVYGLAKQRTNGDWPSVSTLGQPTLTSNDLRVVVQKATPAQSGVLFYGTEQTSVPFHGGTLLLGGTLQRQGSFTADANGRAEVPCNVYPGMLGTARMYQAIFRDPSAADGYGVTNAVRIQFCP
jgi:hypothetical protein